LFLTLLVDLEHRLSTRFSGLRSGVDRVVEVPAAA
jgi:hypothetical protein